MSRPTWPRCASSTTSTTPGLQNTTRWGETEQDYLLTSFMASQRPDPLLDAGPRRPVDLAIARSLPTFKDQTNRILTNQTNLTAPSATQA